MKCIFNKTCKIKIRTVSNQISGVANSGEKKLKFRQIKKMDITPPDVVNHYVT